LILLLIYYWLILTLFVSSNHIISSRNFR